MELRELRLVVGRHKLVAILTFVVVVCVGVAAAYMPAKTYRTSATAVLDVDATSETGSTIQQITFLLPAIQEWAQSRSLRERAADRVPVELQVPPAAIKAQVDASVMRVAATAGSPQAAQAWANAVTAQLISERGEGQGVSIVPLDEAPLKRGAVSPQSEPILLAAVVLGLIAALFAALAAERIKQAFDTKQAVRERFGATVLGEIPLMRRSERRTPVIELLNGPRQSVDIIAAFEALRTNVEFRLMDHGATRLCVISMDRHAGKSTVAAGLACAMVKVGRRVIAVEADLRRPSLADQLKVPPSPGLGDLAVSGIPDVLLQKTLLESLQLLPAGIPAGRAADVISMTLPSALAEIDRDGATLIVDSPPLRGAPETAIVISQAPNVVLVVNNSNSDLEGLSDAVATINEAGGILLGIVINRVPRRRLRRDSYPDFESRAHPVEPVTVPSAATDWER
jgi:Mrp family chromosome partitioning ATPase